MATQLVHARTTLGLADSASLLRARVEAPGSTFLLVSIPEIGKAGRCGANTALFWHFPGTFWHVNLWTLTPSLSPPQGT